MPLDDLQRDAASSDAAAEGGWCARNALDGSLCQDFDEVSSITATKTVGTAADIALEDANVLSAPGAARASLRVVDGGGKAEAWLVYNPATGVSTYTVDFNVFVETTGSTDAPQMLALVFVDGQSTVLYELDVVATSSTNLHIDDFGAPDSDGGHASNHWACNNAIATNAWSHIVVKVDFVAKMLTMTSQGTTCVSQPLAANAQTGIPAIQFGIYSSNAVEPWQWDFDNVVITSN